MASRCEDVRPSLRPAFLCLMIESFYRSGWLLATQVLNLFFQQLFFTFIRGHPTIIFHTQGQVVLWKKRFDFIQRFASKFLVFSISASVLFTSCPMNCIWAFFRQFADRTESSRSPTFLSRKGGYALPSSSSFKLSGARAISSLKLMNMVAAPWVSSQHMPTHL